MRIDKIVKEWREHNREPELLKEGRATLKFPQFKRVNQRPEMQSVDIKDKKSAEKFVRMVGQYYKNALVKAYKTPADHEMNKGLPDILQTLKERGMGIEDDLVQQEIKNAVNETTRDITEMFQRSQSRGALFNADHVFGAKNLDQAGPLFNLMNVKKIKRHFQDLKTKAMMHPGREKEIAKQDKLRNPDTVKKHEGMHYTFSEIKRQYGENVYKNIIDVIYKIIKNVSPESFEVLFKFVQQDYDLSNKYRFLEECFNIIHTILEDREYRNRFKKYVSTNYNLKSRQAINGFKTAWKRIIKFSQRVTPEEMGA